jgi:hypothetical protein
VKLRNRIGCVSAFRLCAAVACLMGTTACGSSSDSTYQGETGGSDSGTGGSAYATGGRDATATGGSAYATGGSSAAIASTLCPGTIGNTCGSAVSTTQLAACRAGNCCSSLSACAASTSCYTLWTCVMACSTDTCITNCAKTTPSGVTLLTTYLTCEDTFCSAC